MANTCIGTPFYLAPEVVRSRRGAEGGIEGEEGEREKQKVSAILLVSTPSLPPPPLSLYIYIYNHGTPSARAILCV